MTCRSSCGVEHWSLGTGLSPAADIGTDLAAEKWLKSLKTPFFESRYRLYTCAVRPPFPGIYVLFLSGATVLEPDLSHAFGESGDLSNALQILAVWIGVDLEVGLQDLDLFLGERRSHSLGLLFRLRL